MPLPPQPFNWRRVDGHCGILVDQKPLNLPSFLPQKGFELRPSVFTTSNMFELSRVVLHNVGAPKSVSSVFSIECLGRNEVLGLTMPAERGQVLQQLDRQMQTSE